MIALRDCKTARMYQQGMSRHEAMIKGADPATFDGLVAKYQDGSIPTSDWVGFKATPPYSCEYHTGGKMGAQLRELCAAQR